MAQKNLENLADDLDRLVKELPSRLAGAANAAAMATLDYLAWNTPVDTSNAVSNWQVALNAPILSEIQPYSMGWLGSTHFASANAMLAAAQKTLEIRKIGQKIFISNNVDYIQGLNQGSSKQAPAGFVEVSVVVGRYAANQYKVKLK